MDDDAAAGGDGRSWATAYSDLQDALADADSSGGSVTEVWVAEGTYRPDRGTGARDAAFTVHSATDLLGGFAGNELDASLRDPTAHPTALSGDLLGDDDGTPAKLADNSRHVMIADQATAGHRIDGFIIVAGNADGVTARDGSGAALYVSLDRLTIANCVFRHNSAANYGGALFARDGALVIDRCEFSDNAAGGDGGAVTSWDCDVDLGDSDLLRNVAAKSAGALELDTSESNVIRTITVRDCRIEDNRCQFFGGGLGSFINGTVLRIERCNFARNDSGTGAEGGGAALRGSEAGALENDVAVVESDFTDNKGWDAGGGLYLSGPESTLVANCTFRRNTAFVGGGALDEFCGAVEYFGCRFLENSAIESGGLSCGADSTVAVRGCVFAGNTASDRIGALYVSNNAVVERCSITGNSAVNVIGGIASGSSRNTASHLIVWDNADASGTSQPAEISGFGRADYCCIEGWDGTLKGKHSFSADPRFIDAPAFDLRVASDSPCIDAGDPSLTATVEPFDLDHRSRCTDGDLDRDLRIDLGALEFTHVELALTGVFSPGGRVTFDTSGTAGLPVLLIFAAAPGTLLIHSIGYLGVDLGAICGCLPWTPAPSAIDADIPVDAPAMDLWLQEVAFSGAAADFSQVVPLAIR